jgi:hypothetical protein
MGGDVTSKAWPRIVSKVSVINERIDLSSIDEAWLGVKVRKNYKIIQT